MIATQESATSPITSHRRVGRAARLDVVERPEARKLPARLERTTWRAGTIADSVATTKQSTNESRIIRGSISTWANEDKGDSVGGIGQSIMSPIHMANSRPTPVAVTASSNASVNVCAKRRMGPAPSARRSPYSACRESDRARRRLATLAQATSRRRMDTQVSAASGERNVPWAPKCDFHKSSTTALVPACVAGYSAASRRATALAWASSCSNVASERRQPTKISGRALRSAACQEPAPPIQMAHAEVHPDIQGKSTDRRSCTLLDITQSLPSAKNGANVEPR